MNNLKTKKSSKRTSNEDISKTLVADIDALLDGKAPDGESWVTIYQYILEALGDKDKEL